MCAKNHVNIFGSFLDIRQNAEWARFLAHPVYALSIGATIDVPKLHISEIQGH